MEAWMNSLLKKAARSGFEECEVYYGSGKSLDIRIFNGQLAQYKNTSSQGLSFRGVYKGKMGGSYSEDLSEASLDILVEQACKNAEISEDENPAFLYRGDKEYLLAEEKAGSGISVTDQISLAMEMEKAAYAYDKRVRSVDYCLLGTGQEKLHIINTLGTDLSHGYPYTMAYVNARVQESEKEGFKLAGEFWQGMDAAALEPERLAKAAVTKAVSYLGAEAVPSGQYSIIFDPNSAAKLLTVFAGAFHGELIQKGFSLLKDRLGEIIASPVITLRDDKQHVKSIFTFPFDSEGVKCYDKAVIEKGLFKTALYNLKAAAKEGVKSTGNGFRASFRSPVDTAGMNFYIEPSDQSHEALMETMGDGLVITELSGLHSGANAISGDFSLSSAGYLVKNGRVQRPVEQITVAGNIYDLLKNAEAIGSDLRFQLPSSAGVIGSPSLLAGKLNIGGL